MALLNKVTVRGQDELLTTIVNFLTDTPGTPGRDWVVHADYRTLSAPYQYKRVVLRNTGKSNNENIYIGIYAAVHSAGVEAGLILKTYTYFDNSIVSGNYATNFFNTTYGSAEGAHATRSFMPFKTNEASSEKPPMDLWVFSNKSRVVLILNTEERYSNGYIGQYIRHVTPQEVPYPLVCFADSFNGGNVSQGEALWSTYFGYQVVDSGLYNSWGSDRRSLIYTRHSPWSNDKYAGGYRHFACNRVMTPTGWGYDWWIDPTEAQSYGIVTETNVNYPDGGIEQVLLPCYVNHYTAGFTDTICLGQLDGVYWAPSNKNTILTTVGSSDCIIFPDLNRTYWYSWMAIKDTL